MTDPTKHLHHIKTFFTFRTKSTVAFAYGFMFAFFVFTIFIVFNPSQTPLTSTASYGSQFSSLLSCFLPNSSQPLQNPIPILPPKNFTRSPTVEPHKSLSLHVGFSNGTQNPTGYAQNRNKSLVMILSNGTQNPNGYAENRNKSLHAFLSNATQILILSNGTQNPNGYAEKRTKSLHAVLSNATQISILSNGTQDSTGYAENRTNSHHAILSNGTQIPSGYGKNRTEEKGLVTNLKNQSNGNGGLGKKQGSGDLINCDLFDGDWVLDESYPLYKPGSCSLIDEQFNCFANGRPDNYYQKLKWKPKGCTLPRLNGSHMLELLRGKRLVFVGDSLNRNMWESLVCILRNSVNDKRKVYEASGRQKFRSEASFSFIFQDYNCTVEFFVTPFLVREWEMKDKNGTKKETLRLDLIDKSSTAYKNADIIIFNTGHWWTHDKTSKGKDYYQEGNHVHDELNVLEAFKRALTTWARWIDTNVNPIKSLVFFRGYSASHFSGGQWNSGGQCDNETEPIRNSRYLTEYPPKMTVLEEVLKGMNTGVTYLNITRMTDYRKDGHPSIYRKQHYTKEEKKAPLQFQDCSHWCLPGVPDAWNELIYAELLVKEYQKHQQEKEKI